MTVKEELQKLTPINRKEILPTLLASAMMMGLGLYFDHSKFFAFCVVPVVTITSFTSKMNLWVLKTPKLYFLMIALVVGVIMAGASFVDIPVK